ncbi:hypothetical protein Tco_0639035 [Tanacetum coccineum]
MERYSTSQQFIGIKPLKVYVVKLWFRWISFDYRIPLGFGSIVGGLDHVNLVIRLPIEHRISKGTRVGMGADVDISALTIEQYMALIQDNNRSGMVKPKISDDVEFEINANFMRELRCKLFIGAGLKVEKRLPAGMINTWDLLEKEFIWQHCSPIKTAKKLEEICNFKQEIDETLYHACERYSDLLYKCPQHDMNCQQKYDETTTKKKINDSPDNIDAIQESFKEAHPTKGCPLKKEDKARMTMGKENMKEPVPRDLPPTLFLGHLKEQIGEMDVGWDITVEGVERLWQFFTPTIHTLPNLEPVVQPYMSLGRVHDKEKIIRGEEHDYDIPLQDGTMQPLTPQTLHITPPDYDYVALATSPILDKQLIKFGKSGFE